MNNTSYIMPDKPQLISHHSFNTALLQRPDDSHKGMFGSVCVIGGSQGMTGAVVLAARAALMTGCGLVRAGFLSSNAPGTDLLQPELMLCDVKTALQSSHSVYVVGCGMAQDSRAKKILQQLLSSHRTLVLDAGALGLLAGAPELAELTVQRQATTLITPHPGEAAQLLQTDSAQIQKQRIAAIQQLHQHLHCHIILKGHHSLYLSANGHLWINHSGNPGMSSAGMGDVLAGICASLLAQPIPEEQAITLALHLHGAAADALAAQGIQNGLTASEVSRQARQLLNDWIQNPQPSNG